MLPCLRRFAAVTRFLRARGARGTTSSRVAVTVWLAVGAARCGSGAGATDPATTTAYAGTYVLVSVDGQIPPARLPAPTSNACPPTVLDGSATVTPTIGNRDPLYTVLVTADPLVPPVPALCGASSAVFDVVRDVGVWSQAPGGLRFKSDLGAGAYMAEVGGSNQRPELTMSVRGHTLVFVRAQPYGSPSGGVVTQVVDAAGADVVQAIVTCQQNDLVVARRLIFQGPAQTVVPRAPTTVSVSLPTGCHLATGQASQVTVEPSETTPVVTVRFVAERTGN